MKKPLYPFFVLFFFLFSAFKSLAAANEPVTLTWKGNVQVAQIKDKPVLIPTFSGAAIDPKSKLPVYSLRLPNVNASEFSLKNPVYVPFTAEEVKSLPKDRIKASPEIKIETGTSNGKIVSIVSFSPIRQNPQTGQLEKLTQFDYTFTDSPLARKERGNTRSRTHKTNSVLSSGSWFKVGVTQTGIYKIDRTYLQNLGVNMNGLDPRRLQVFGNGGGMLPQANSAPRYDDLVENAVMVVGENDGNFDNGDYLLFYGQGPHTWSANAAKTGFNHNLNIYSDTTYYFITVGNTPGRRVTSTTVSPSGSAPTITKFNERAFRETEKVNLLTSGREWYGEEFNSYTQNLGLSFTEFSDLVPNSPIAVTSSVLGISPVCTTCIGGRFSLKLNNVPLGTQETFGHGGFDYHDAGEGDSTTFFQNLSAIPYNNSELRVDIAFDQMGMPSATGHLDYILINAQRQLKLYGNQTTFRSFENVAPNAVSQFKLSNVNVNGNETFVWDVTNSVRPRKMDANFANAEATFYAKTDTVREFIIFTGSNFATPTPFGYIQNQNLHSLNQDGKIDLVIVTNPSLYNQAQRLANHRSNHDKLKVAVVTTKQVFNEFSSGAQDVTAIRDLMKMFYDRKVQNNTKTNDSLIYLLILGDASYDYKSKFSDNRQNRTQNNTNLVPVYESRQSLSATYTYSSEDYFGLLDDTEGEWHEGSNTELLDIGIGRIPAHSVNDAEVMVNKIIAYSNPDHFGKWRNKLALVADDEDGSSHLDSSEEISFFVTKNYPTYDQTKVYLDMYRQIAAPNGQRSPDAAAEIDRTIEQGSLILNYVGHGGETGLAHEQIVTVNQVNSWSNANMPTFLVTATCEFGRYDDPRRNSAAELSILNPHGGAIGLITTTRPVFAHTNKMLNNSFFGCVFEKINGRTPRLGDIFLNTKNNASLVENRNFTLLCDPTMKLAYPEEEVNVTSVLTAGANMPDTLSALSTVSLTGSVTNAAKQVLTNFNGKVEITVYEKPNTVNTLGDKGSPARAVSVMNNILYNGTVTAKNGLWSSTFVVPKDINYVYGNGKISLYASNNTVDAHGAKTDIVIGGSNSSIPADTIPPVISLFMDNESFVFGGLTGNNTLLISHLSDSSGINTAGLGIGHEITATLDGDKESVKVLNDYYTADLDNFRSGKVRYQFKSLKPGPHELRVKAWDTHNNSSEKRIEFVVANSESLALEHVLNYPNPFSSNTTFHFDHNRAGEDLDIQIQIFTVSGKLIRTLQAQSFGSKPHVAEISWNGRDEYNDVLAKGVYIYKLNVRSVRDGNKVSKYEKLVLLN